VKAARDGVAVAQNRDAGPSTWLRAGAEKKEMSADGTWPDVKLVKGGKEMKMFRQVAVMMFVSGVAAGLVLACATPARADFVFKRIAGESAAPAGGGGTFRQVSDARMGPALSDESTAETVAFTGWLSDGTYGLYDSHMALSGRVVFDTTTEAPPSGSGELLHQPRSFAFDEKPDSTYPAYGYVIDPPSTHTGQPSVYRGTGTRVADLATIAPGYGVPFESFTQTDVYGRRQVFAAGTSATHTLTQNGLYLFNDSTDTLTRFMDDTAAVPDAPGETFLHYYHPQFTEVGGSTRIYFGGFSNVGRYGLYSMDTAGGDLLKIVDSQDIVPDTGNPVGNFLRYSVHEGNVALGANGVIVTVDSGTLATAVPDDVTDPEDGSGFTGIGMEGVSRWGDNIAFTATRNDDGAMGLYFLEGATLHRVTASGDDFNGYDWAGFGIGNRSVRGDTVAFTMDGEGSSAVYTATLGGTGKTIDLDDTYARARAGEVDGDSFDVTDDTPPYGVTVDVEHTEGAQTVASGHGRATINPFGGGGSVAAQAYAEGEYIPFGAEATARHAWGAGAFVSQLEPVGGDEIIDFDLGWLLTGALSIREEDSRVEFAFTAQAASETSPEVTLVDATIKLFYDEGLGQYMVAVFNTDSDDDDFVMPLVDIEAPAYDSAFVVTPQANGVDLNVSLDILLEDVFFLAPGEHVSLYYALGGDAWSDAAGWADIDFGDTWDLQPESDTPGVEFVVVDPSTGEPIPEPGAWGLLLIGWIGLARKRRR